MKSMPVIFACLVVLAFCGCNPAGGRQSRVEGDGDQALLDQEKNPSRLETIAYYWENYRIKVSFYRQSRDSSWTMTVRDSWDLFDQSLSGKEKAWDLQECRCSMEECVEVIDRSLASFRSERPDAKLESLALEMQVVRDLWREVLTGLRGTLGELDGEKQPTRLDTPDEVNQETQRVLNRSSTITAISTLLKKHGMTTQGVFQSNEILFKDSLQGRKWLEIATLPGAGVLVPGTVELAFDQAGL